MNAKLIIPAIVAAFGLSSCVVHDWDHHRHNPAPPVHNVVVNHDYRPAPKPAPRPKAQPQPKPKHHAEPKPKKHHTPAPNHHKPHKR